MSAPEPGKIRNVAVVGHRGTGKTSLVEALLFQSGEVNRLGTIEAGTTTGDWEEDEHKRQMSIALSVAHASWQDRKINLIDTPGDPGFQGEVRGALRVVEGALVVVSAVMGVEVGTSPHLAARRRARPLTGRLRQHARPRASGFLPDARAAPVPAVAAVRRRASPDRLASTSSSAIVDVLHMCAYTSPEGGSGGRARSPSRTSSPESPPSTARSCSTRSSRPTRR